MIRKGDACEIRNQQMTLGGLGAKVRACDDPKPELKQRIETSPDSNTM